MELSQQQVLPEVIVYRVLLDFTIFYTSMFFLFSLLLSFLLDRPFEKVANSVGVGLVFGFLPPILDYLARHETFLPYQYFTQLSWSLYSPDQPMGETITLWLLIASSGVFLYLLKRSVKILFLGMLGAYCIIQSLSFVLIVIHRFTDISQVEFMGNITFVTISFLCYLLLNGKKLTSSLKRLNHGLPHFCLVLFGSVYSGQSIASGIEKASLILFLIFVLLVQNDHYDTKEDTFSGRKTNVKNNDVVWTGYFVIFFAFCYHAQNHLLFYYIALFFLAGFLYHHPVFRLKERFCLSYTIEGIWALLAFLIGSLQPSGYFPKNNAFIGLLIFGGGMLLSIPKDWKDIESDRQATIPTYYVVLLQAGWNPQKAHIFIVSAVTLGLMLPVLLMFFIKTEFTSALLSFCMALLPAFCLVKIRNRKLAVEATMYAYSLYIMSFVFFAIRGNM
ncbi:MAG: hypothetical protein AAF518_24805 [Spirochaetota bacterium]